MHSDLYLELCKNSTSTIISIITGIGMSISMTVSVDVSIGINVMSQYNIQS